MKDLFGDPKRYWCKIVLVQIVKTKEERMELTSECVTNTNKMGVFNKERSESKLGNAAESGKWRTL